MFVNLSKALLIAFVLFIAAFLLSRLAKEDMRGMPAMIASPETAAIEVACQWLARLIGGTIFLVAILGGLTRHENALQAFAMRIAMALIGLEVAYPHWSLVTSISAIVITLLVLDGICRRRAATQ